MSYIKEIKVPTAQWNVKCSSAHSRSHGRKKLREMWTSEEGGRSREPTFTMVLKGQSLHMMLTSETTRPEELFSEKDLKTCLWTAAIFLTTQAWDSRWHRPLSTEIHRSVIGISWFSARPAGHRQKSIRSGLVFWLAVIFLRHSVSENRTGSFDWSGSWCPATIFI